MLFFVTAPKRLAGRSATGGPDRLPMRAARIQPWGGPPRRFFFARRILRLRTPVAANPLSGSPLKSCYVGDEKEDRWAGATARPGRAPGRPSRRGFTALYLPLARGGAGEAPWARMELRGMEKNGIFHKAFSRFAQNSAWLRFQRGKSPERGAADPSRGENGPGPAVPSASAAVLLSWRPLSAAARRPRRPQALRARRAVCPAATVRRPGRRGFPL